VAYASLESCDTPTYRWRGDVAVGKAKVMGMPMFNVEGGRYRKICKVWISRMINIPTIVDFARKKFKPIS
jgi:hypothetical protein